jgi:hypothetical protein
MFKQENVMLNEACLLQRRSHGSMLRGNKIDLVPCAPTLKGPCKVELVTDLPWKKV